MQALLAEHPQVGHWVFPQGTEWCRTINHGLRTVARHVASTCLDLPCQAQVTDLPAGVCELLLAEQRSKQVQAPTWG